MASLDRIIRPFTAFDVTPAVRNPGVVNTNVENVVLSVGEVGEGKTFTGSSSFNESKYMDGRSKEIRRNSKQKRIENPDNPDDFVKVANVKSIDVGSGSGLQYQKTTHVYQDKKEPGETP